MGKTVWIKNVKEGFVDSSTDTDEKILMGSNSTEQIKIETNTKTEEPEQSFTTRLTELSNNFNKEKAKLIYDDFVKYATNGTFNIHENIAEKLIGLGYGKKDSSKSKRDKKIISSQISLWIAFLITSYLFVVNWWYLLCYTNYEINFRDYIWSPLHWPMSGPIGTMEAINVATYSFRMHSNSGHPITPEVARNLWNLRPIIFSAFHLLIFLIMLFVPLTKFVENTMLSNGLVFSIISAFSVYYFFSSFIKEKWYEKFLNSGTIIAILILIGLIIVSCLMMFGFISIVCPVLLIIFLVLSYFGIFIFNGFSSFSVYQQIFQELKEAPVDEPVDKFGKLKNAIFNNFHGIYILFFIIIILITNIKQSLAFSNNSLIAVAVIINMFIFIVFAPSSFKAIMDIFKIILEDTTSMEKTDEKLIIPDEN